MAALTWRKIDPRDNVHNDQRADLVAHHWADIGPDDRGWSVTIIRGELPTCDQLGVFDAVAPTEAAAKVCVEAWQASYHRNAVLVTPQRGSRSPFRWRVTCRECDLYGHGLSLPDAHDIGTKHAARTSCSDLWHEHLVGVR